MKTLRGNRKKRAGANERNRDVMSLGQRDSFQEVFLVFDLEGFVWIVLNRRHKVVDVCVMAPRDFGRRLEV